MISRICYKINQLLLRKLQFKTKYNYPSYVKGSNNGEYTGTYICIRQLSTIYALSSGNGRCGVSIIRISGEKTEFILSKLVRKKLKPRYATLTTIYFPYCNDILDKGIVLWYPSK